MKLLSVLLFLTLLIAFPVQAQECEAGFRLYSHRLLATDPICIPEDPQRIAFIDSTIAIGIALDVPSVTRNYYFDAFLGDFPALEDEETIRQMADVGDTWEINAEALLEAAPDLIVSATWWPESNAYAQEIAPTVIFDFDKAESWLETFDAVAQLLDRTEEQAALLEGIDARIATLSELLGEDAADTTFTVVIIETAEQLWMFTSKNFGAELAIKAGLSMADTVPTPEEAEASGDGPYAVGISLERLPLIDADHIFIFTNYGDTVQEELFASPIWQAFAAPNPDRIHFIPAEYWVRDHPISAHRVLDDLFRYVAGLDPEVVSPNPFAYTYQVSAEVTEVPSE